jgi:hypothetical protein
MVEPTRDSVDILPSRYAIALVAVIAATTVIRGLRLDHPMRYDEAFTFLVYVAPTGLRQLFNYSTPNNHLLHTLLVKAASLLFGQSPWGLRMPAFLAGVAIVPAVAGLACKVSGRRSAGLIAAVLACSSSILIEYSVNARGYSLICLFALLQAHAASRLLDDSGWAAGWALWVGLTALGILTIPIMLYPTAISASLVLLQRRFVSTSEGCHTPMRRLFLAPIVALSLAILLYTPTFLISGTAAVLSNPFVTPKPMDVVWTGLPRAALETLRLWMRHTSWAWLGMVTGGLVWAVVVGARRRHAFLLLPVLAPALLMMFALVQRVTPYPRVWLFAWPLLLAVAASGIDSAARALLPTWRHAWGVALIGVLAVGIAAADQSMREPYLISEDPRTMVAAPRIVHEAGMAGLYDGRSAMVWDWDVPNWPPLQYYVILNRPPGQRLNRVLDADCRRVFIVLADYQELEGLYRSHPGLRDRYGPPEFWRQFENSRVLLAWRRAAP